MITVYQELTPLTNQRYDRPVSENGKFTNPVIIPFTLNATGAENILETVIYIRNDSQVHFYKNILITLMKEDGSTSPADVSGIIDFDNDQKFSLNNTLDVDTSLAFEYTGPLPTGQVILNSKYKSNYVPIFNDPNIDVKFSWGYPELSFRKWDDCKSALLIPYIGTSGMGDTRYFEVRMRIKWKTLPSIFTIRDYFLDVSYEYEEGVSI